MLGPSVLLSGSFLCDFPLSNELPVEFPSEEGSQAVLPPAEDVAEIMSEAPVIVPQDPVEETPSEIAGVTEEATHGSTLEVTTKYVVETNNGNFPDPTERPHEVDDNLLGNNGFFEQENSVSDLQLISNGV